jgi:2-keto-3-deoxy-L-fuconate dehydrogenase
MGMSGRLHDKVAVVTGAGQGIGKAAAVAFIAEGATVWAVDRNPSALSTLVAELPDVITAVLDVTEGRSVAELASRIDGVDVLFNCAGYVHSGNILECSDQEWEEAVAVNVKSIYLMIRAFLPGMVDAGHGSIINMASVVSSISGVPNRFAYGTSKAAVIGLTKAVAADFVGSGVRCNAIAPGTVETPSLLQRLEAFTDPAAAREAFIARQPMGRLGTPEEIAALAVHLASDESAYATGTVYVSDGGMTL